MRWPNIVIVMAGVPSIMQGMLDEVAPHANSRQPDGARARNDAGAVDHPRPTAWLGMLDSNSGIHARAMYLRYRGNSCWLGQKSPAETIRVLSRPVGIRSLPRASSRTCWQFGLTAGD